MELLGEISDGDLGYREYSQARYSVRKAARAVLLNGRGEVALMHSLKQGYYKLPGGGVEKGETVEEAARREILEETGCAMGEAEPLGLIVEYRGKEKIILFSYCFLSRTVGSPARPSLTSRERAQAFRVEWVGGFGEALELLKGRRSMPYFVRFMVERDAMFVRKAQAVSGPR
jgi:ADP-ribose pyrophosphatase YjhB (NUDIX family)